MAKDLKEHPDVTLCRELHKLGGESAKAADRIMELRQIVKQMEKQTRLAARNVARAGRPPTNF